MRNEIRSIVNNTMVNLWPVEFKRLRRLSVNNISKKINFLFIMKVLRMLIHPGAFQACP
jgi:hypothetical protein